MRSGNRTQIGTSCSNDAVGMVGFADRAHGHGRNTGLLSNAVCKRGLIHAAKHRLFELADLPR